jgi:hypothetical protein
MEPQGTKNVVLYIRGELICSLGVDGERTETEKFPSPIFFTADGLDE